MRDSETETAEKLFEKISVCEPKIIPTIIKSYHRPKDEDFSAWFVTWVSDTINLFAIEKYTFGIFVYPIYMFLMTSIIVVILLSKRLSKNLKVK